MTVRRGFVTSGLIGCLVLTGAAYGQAGSRESVPTTAKAATMRASAMIGASV